MVPALGTVASRAHHGAGSFARAKATRWQTASMPLAEAGGS